MAPRPKKPSFVAEPPPAAEAAVVKTEMSVRNLGLLTQVIGFRFRRVQNHLSRSLAQMPEFDGGKPGEFSVLAIIAANPGLSQIAVADEVGLDKAMIVIVIDELERQGWARRERAADDRRRNLLFITPQGEKTLDRWFALARENERRVRETMSEAEFAQLSDLLDRIYNQCFNHVED